MQKRKRIKVHGNKLFRVTNVFFGVAIIGLLIVSIADKYLGLVQWYAGYENIIGVSSQIITAISSLVVSIIGIAISLQNEEFFGIKITKLYALRVKYHYSIRQIIIISIILCFTNMTCYMVGMTLAAMGLLVITLVFLIRVVYAEIPIMAKEEHALLQILKDNIINCYLKNEEASKDLKEAVKYLLYRKNLKELYGCFCDKYDEEYNRYLLLKLLEYQHDLAFSMPNKSEEEQRIIGSSLLDNVFDVIFRHIDFSDKTYEEIRNSAYLLTRVLFRINDIPNEKNPLIDKISVVIHRLTFSLDSTEEKDDFATSIIVILVAEAVKNNDFRMIKIIRRQFSQMEWGLKKDSPALLLFSVLSLQLYYLCCSEQGVPGEIKESIINFINEKNMIEENTKICSWKELFKEAAEEFNLNYDRFLNFTLKHQNNIEYWLFGTGAKYVVLEAGYVTFWYLTHLLNRNVMQEIDFAGIASNHAKFYPRLIDFGNKCFDANKNFIPTDEMKRIVNFYDDTNEPFSYFQIYERRNRTLFNFINKIKIENIKNETDMAKRMNSMQLANDIMRALRNALKAEWGFDSTIEIDNSERFFSVLLEKFPEAANFEECIMEYCERSVFRDIEDSIQKTIVYKNEDFERNIKKWLKKTKYVIGSVKETIPYFFIHTDSIRELFEKESDTWTKVDSKLLGQMSLVVDKGFGFNCEIKEVRFFDLSEEELSQQVAKYQREDGQYVFRGTFLPKEEIANIIKNKFTILKVVIRHQVISSKKSILELKPYTTRGEDA